MIGLLALGVGLLAVAALGVALIEVLLRRADIGAGLVLGLTVLNAVLLDQVPALAAPGGMRVPPTSTAVQRQRRSWPLSRRKAMARSRLPAPMRANASIAPGRGT